jgi:hypothetical protein
MSKEMEPQQQLPGMPNNDSNTSGDNSPRTPEELQEYTAEIARKIAEAADKRGPIEYEDRKSEAAKDQGHGTAIVFDIENVPEENPGDRKKAQRRRTHPSARYRRPNYVGPIPGDESDSTTDGRHAVEYPDDEHKAAAAKNVPLAREAITAGPEDNDPDTQSTTNLSKPTPEEIAVGQKHIENIRNIRDAQRNNKP